MPKREELEQVKLSNKTKVFNYLKERGYKGATTDELKKVHHRFSSGINLLKDDGWVIADEEIGYGKKIYAIIGFSEKQKEERKKKSKEKVFEEVDRLKIKEFTSNHLEEILEKFNATIKGK